MRVRFNCPSTGKFRILEVTGVATTDNATNRCDATAYPSPGPNDTLRSTPSFVPSPFGPASTIVASPGFNLYFFKLPGQWKESVGLNKLTNS